MKKMIEEVWNMFTEKEKYALHFERINTIEDLTDLLEPDWDYNDWQSAEEIYTAIKEEILF